MEIIKTLKGKKEYRLITENDLCENNKGGTKKNPKPHAGCQNKEQAKYIPLSYYQNNGKDKYIPIVVEINKEDLKSHTVKNISQFNNNIWVYTVFTNNEDERESQYDAIEKDIDKNYDLNLYSSKVAVQYLKFFVRMCEQNYFDTPNRDPIEYRPFVFSCKTQNKKQVITNIKECNKIIRALPVSTTNKLKVKVLIIDDYANKALSEWSGGSEETHTNTNGSAATVKNKGIQHWEGKAKATGIEKIISKAKILNDIWERNVIISNVEDNLISLDVYYLDNFGPDFISEIIDSYFDIILIDYNLKAELTGVDITCDILGRFCNDATKDTKTNLRVMGPYHKPWIIPITSYTHAFTDEMRYKGISFADHRYTIARGADFINTPELFLYYFTKIVKEILVPFKRLHKLENTYMTQIVKDERVFNMDDKQSKQLINQSYNDFLEWKKDINFILEQFDNSAKENGKKGIVGDIVNKSGDKRQNSIKNKIFYYEQLMYNLKFRNFPSNEEAINFYNLLKESNNGQ